MQSEPNDANSSHDFCLDVVWPILSNPPPIILGDFKGILVRAYFRIIISTIPELMWGNSIETTFPVQENCSRSQPLIHDPAAGKEILIPGSGVAIISDLEELRNLPSLRPSAPILYRAVSFDHPFAIFLLCPVAFVLL